MYKLLKLPQGHSYAEMPRQKDPTIIKQAARWEFKVSLCHIRSRDSYLINTQFTTRPSFVQCKINIVPASYVNRNMRTNTDPSSLIVWTRTVVPSWTSPLVLQLRLCTRISAVHLSRRYFCEKCEALPVDDICTAVQSVVRMPIKQND